MHPTHALKISRSERGEVPLPGFNDMAAKHPFGGFLQHLQLQGDLPLDLFVGVPVAEVDPAVNSWKRGRASQSLFQPIPGWPHQTPTRDMELDKLWNRKSWVQILSYISREGWGKDSPFGKRTTNEGEGGKCGFPETVPSVQEKQT